MRKLAFFSALCFFLSAVEYAIPKPVPFFRIGLANLPVMISFLCMKKKESAALIFLKVLLQGIISGTLFSYVFLFSLAGSVSSGFIMMFLFQLLYKKNLISWLGISMAGALANNLSQLAVAYVFLFGENIKFIAPVLLAISFIASIIMGLFAGSFVEKSRWLKNLNEKTSAENFSSDFLKTEILSEEQQVQKKSQAIIFAAVLLMFIVLFFAKSVYAAAAVFVLSAAACFIKNKKIKILPSVSVILSVTFFSLLVPYGKVLAEIWKFKITDGAVLSGLERSLKLCSCVFLSKLITGPQLKLPSKAGNFMSLVFKYFEKLSERNGSGKISLKNLAEELDKKLESVYDF